MSFKKGHEVTKETRDKIRKTLTGHLVSQATKEKIRLSGVGRISKKRGVPISEEQKRKMVETRIKNGSYLRGELNPRWKGGICYINENDKIRKSVEYRLWRKAVFERDNYTCIWCGDNKGGNLEADHIKPFAQYPELRFAIDNGRTLCKDCHRKTDTYAGKGYKRFL